MTVDQAPAATGGPDDDTEPATPPDGAAAALARYRARTRRQRRVYFAIVTIVVAAVSAVVAVVWSHGEVAHTRLRTVAAPPSELPLAAPSPTPARAWASDDAAALGSPYWKGAVVTHSAHGVRGRDARTGKITWSYTRTDRTVCAAIQVQGVTIAIFKVHGNCDQLTALDSRTGTREWTRTLDENGHPVEGRPSYSIGRYTVLMTTPSVIYAIDPAGGLDRWLFSQPGCRIDSAVLGSQGALVSQNCTAPQCSGLKFCGSGPQLLLRDATAGRDDDSGAKNPDQIKWNLIGNTEIPVSADRVTTSLDPGSHALRVRSVDKGRLTHTLTLHPVPSTARGAVATETGQAELIWLDGATYAIGSDGAATLWTARTAAAPTVVDPNAGDGDPDLSSARITVADRTGIATLDGATGASGQHVDVPAPPAGARVYPLGSGFLVAGTHTTAYR